MAAGSSAPASAIKLRRPPQGDGLDAVVAGLLGRANNMQRRTGAHPQLPDPTLAMPEGTAQNPSHTPAPSQAPFVAQPFVAQPFVPAPSLPVRAARRWPWIALAFVAGAGVATTIALALAS